MAVLEIGHFSLMTSGAVGQESDLQLDWEDESEFTQQTRGGSVRAGLSGDETVRAMAQRDTGCVIFEEL